MSRRVSLAKAHGLGNDFLLMLDLAGPAPFDEEVARRLCDRHRGVGADGLIRITAGQGAYRMDLRNADGGVAEISGTGLRCVALYLVEKGLALGSFEIDTMAGRRTVSVQGSLVSADMSVPVELPPPTGIRAQGLDLCAISIGNPHVVVFVEHPETADVGHLGPAIEQDPGFPGRTNVEFVSVIDRSRVVGRIWERGVGETQASGTGGAACAVAARLRDLVDSDVLVELPGGELGIHWEGPGHSVTMTGPAAVLFELEVDIDALG